MNLKKEVVKIKAFSKKQHVKSSEYLKNNIIMFIILFKLLSLHIVLSFLVPTQNIFLTIFLILLNSYFLYFYATITVHEGAHELIFLGKNKKFIRGIFPSLPLLAGFPFLNAYKYEHLDHHKYLSTKKDPQDSHKTSLIKAPLFFLNKKHIFISLKKHFYQTNLFIFTIAIIFKLAHISLLYYYKNLMGVVLGIALPILIAALLNEFRVTFRHYKLYPNPKPLRSRSYTFLTSRIFGPFGLRYHFEHHLDEKVPGYRLKKVYDFVENNCPKELVNKVHYKKFRFKDFI